MHVKFIDAVVRHARTAVRLPNPLEPLTRLIGGGRDAEEDAETATTAGNRAPALAARLAAPRPALVAAAEPKIEKPADKPLLAAVPMPPSKPTAKLASKPATYEVASAASRPVQLPSRPIQTASLAARTNSPADVIDERGFWHGMPDQIDVPASNTRSGATARRPAADPVATGSLAPWPIPQRLASNVLQAAG